MVRSVNYFTSEGKDRFIRLCEENGYNVIDVYIDTFYDEIGEVCDGYVIIYDDLR